jgi:hypothetical protein
VALTWMQIFSMDYSFYSVQIKRRRWRVWMEF